MADPSVAGPSAAWCNGLEPPGVVRAFQAHPPHGFVPFETTGLPCFEAGFDLLTTADEALRTRVASLPGFARWSRWLTVRTAFVGTTVTEYAPLPRGGAMADWVQGLRDGPCRSHALTIVKDLPSRSPLLPESDNAASEAFAQALAAAGFVAVEGQALAYVPLDFADTDAWLARLSSSRRQNIRRKLRSRAELSIRRIPTGAAFADEALVDTYYALYEAVFDQSEIHFDKHSRGFFATLLKDGGNGGMVFEYRRAADQALVGWNLCFDHGGMLVDKFIGLSYPVARELNLYFVSWIVNLEYALERGHTHYVAGWTDPAVKAQLGARFTATRHMVHVRNPLLRALARRFAGRFENDAHWNPKT